LGSCSILSKIVAERKVKEAIARIAESEFSRDMMVKTAITYTTNAVLVRQTPHI